MDMIERSCREYITALASAAPVPGGGGTAALAGALGTALGNMVCALTAGKKKYAPVEGRILVLKEVCDGLQTQLLELVQADAEGFEPLAKAYAVPKEDPEREEILEEASLAACAAPMRIMELCCRAIECLEELARIGSRLAVSDAGCGAVLCKAALQSAALNVFINTRGRKDRQAFRELDARAKAMLGIYCPRADTVLEAVMAELDR